MMKQILSNALWMLFDKIFILILNLVVTIRVANYYGTLDYGTYQYAVSVVTLFEILVGFIDGRVVKKKYISKNPDELIYTTTIIKLSFSLFSLLGGVIYLILSGENGTYSIIFIVLLVNSIIVNLRFGMQNRYEYMLKSKKVIIAGNIALMVGAIFQLIAVVLHLPIFSIAIINMLSSFLSLLIVYVQYRKDFGNLISTCKKSLGKELLLESLPLALAASCSIVYSRCDSIMIGNILSKEDVGIYAIAIKLISVLQIGISPIRESIYPKMIELYDRDKKQYENRYVQITAILTWTYVVGVLLSFIFLPYAFKLLKPEYAIAFPIYQIYVIGTLFMYNAALRAGHYTLINRGDILMYSQLISVMLNVVLNLILIKAIGVYGAAMATGITQGISLMFSNIFWGKAGKEVLKWQFKGLNPFSIIPRKVAPPPPSGHS